MERLLEGGAERQREGTPWWWGVENPAARVPARNRWETGVPGGTQVQRQVGQSQSAQGDQHCRTLGELSNEFLNSQGPKQVTSSKLEYSCGSDWCLGPTVPHPLRRWRQSVLAPFSMTLQKLAQWPFRHPDPATMTSRMKLTPLCALAALLWAPNFPHHASCSPELLHVTVP